MAKLKEDSYGKELIKRYESYLPKEAKRLALASIELQYQPPKSEAQEWHFDNEPAGSNYFTAVIVCTDHKGTEYPEVEDRTVIGTDPKGTWRTQKLQASGAGKISGHFGGDLHRGPGNPTPFPRRIIAVVLKEEDTEDLNQEVKR